jgi:hypothetical protein
MFRLRIYIAPGNLSDAANGRESHGERSRLCFSASCLQVLRKLEYGTLAVIRIGDLELRAALL